MSPAAIPFGGRRAELIAAGAVALLVCAILAVIAQAMDPPVARWAITLPADARAWGSMMSRLGDSGYMFAISGVVALGAVAVRARARSAPVRLALSCLSERATFVFAVLALDGAATQLVKHVVGRGRPGMFAQFGAFHLSPFTLANASASFPSGHSSTSFAAATAVSLLAPGLAVPLVVLAAAIAASRLVVQAHYLSDVVAGSAFGVACAFLVARLFARVGIAFAGTPAVLKAPGAVLSGLRR